MITLILLLLLASNIKGNEESSIVVEINGKDTTLTFADVTVSDNDSLNVKDVGQVAMISNWVLFGLKEGKEYNIKTWTLAGNCGCSNQICGVDCLGEKGIDCDSNIVHTPLTCMMTTRRGFCWNFVETETSQNYTYFNLNVIGVLALTTYTRAVISQVTPGFTVRSQHAGEKYSLTAMITGYKPSGDISLSDFVYAESEGRVISTQEFAYLTSKPTLSSENVQIESLTCPEDGQPVFKSTRIIPPFNQVGFRSYAILRNANIEKISSLLHLFILTPNGVSQWNKQLTFDIFDPCNQQFLTLRKDNLGNLFVILPATQRLMKEEIICVAVNDVTANIYDLVLYEFRNASAILKTSDRFRGLLSQDYLDSVQLRVTTKASSPIKVSNANIEVSFNLESDSTILKLLTSIPLTCEIFLSSTCHFTITTTEKHLLMTKLVGNDCGFWYETGHFMCEGIAGNFYAPEMHLQAPIRGFTKETMTTTSSEVHRAVSLSTNQSWSSKWSNLTVFEKSSLIIMLVAFAFIIRYITSLFRRSKASVTRKLVKKSEEELEGLVEAENSTRTIGQVLSDDSDDEYPVDHAAKLREEFEIQKRTKVCVDSFFQIYK